MLTNEAFNIPSNKNVRISYRWHIFSRIIVDTGVTNKIIFSFVLDALNNEYKPIEKNAFNSRY